MRIGLTYTGSDNKHENYVRWIQDGDRSVEVVRIAAGGKPFGDLDGLVLSGGVDIAPEFYSATNEYEHAPSAFERSRDLFEMETLERALKQGKPVLGVCRGLQLINVALGGTLVQDLGKEGDAMHEGAGDVDKQHEVHMDHGSLLASVVGAEHGVVNSAHHQAIDRLAAGLRVNAKTADGTIEGIEWADPGQRSFLLAVQWHPERMYVNGLAGRGLYKAIRDRFIGEVKYSAISVFSKPGSAQK